MTTNDILDAQVLIRTKDGRCLVGKTDNRVFLAAMAEFVKFVEVDAGKVEEMRIEELIKSEQ